MILQANVMDPPPVQRQRGTAEQKEREVLANFLQSPAIQSAAIATGAYNPKTDGPLTPDIAAKLAKSNVEFKQVLETELQKAGLFEQWQRFLAEFERRQGFGKPIAEDAKQIMALAGNAIRKNHEEGKQAERRNERLRRLVPSKVRPDEWKSGPANA